MCAETLRLYGSRLTAYERLEVEHYPDIWYLGLDARKIHGEEGAPQNGGYDDENGSYNKVSAAFLTHFMHSPPSVIVANGRVTFSSFIHLLHRQPVGPDRSYTITWHFAMKYWK